MIKRIILFCFFIFFTSCKENKTIILDDNLLKKLDDFINNNTKYAYSESIFISISIETKTNDTIIAFYSNKKLKKDYFIGHTNYKSRLIYIYSD